jgi:hypothetical protein
MTGRLKPTSFSSMRKAISQKVSVGEQQARELGFPVQDEKLRVFLKSFKD